MSLSRPTVSQLCRIVGEPHITQKKEDLALYSYDATGQSYWPDAVVFPADHEEIAAILQLANQERFYVVPRGAGSGMTGGSLPVMGGIVLATTRLNRILEIDTDNLIARAEPGVITGHFHKAVEKLGLFYPPDPASSDFSTLGGNAGECAGGPRAVKYGVTRDYVMGLTAVLPTGDTIHTGVQTAKGVSGYDLTRLLVGSEGTLGIITSLTLRLIPLPAAIRTMTAIFARMETAADAVSEIMRSGIVPRSVEFMDNASIRCAEAYLGAGLPVDAGAILILEVDGSETEVEHAAARLVDLCRAVGADTVELARNEAERANLWKARKAISPALYQIAPDKINEDIVVPKNKIPVMVRKIERLGKESGLTIASFGHAGDGNIHVNIMLDKKDAAQRELAETTVQALFDHTLKLGGTLSGEHGIGITKAPYLNKEIGPVEMSLMRGIKSVFDPNGILNPGKIFPTA